MPPKDVGRDLAIVKENLGAVILRRDQLVDEKPMCGKKAGRQSARIEIVDGGTEQQPVVDNSESPKSLGGQPDVLWRCGPRCDDQNTVPVPQERRAHPGEELGRSIDGAVNVKLNNHVPPPV